ncbi:uncharacterized protein LOC131687012 [Topomyia yanbarensis]|uniref:uncharacterized protein LOC131687012 n=1 Tax=Topomyia yanbarensis TaxID=2498891 RepID=UPI00273CB629|nr:uncharacterized protein LOC131687012 [Topomyia yanbarensis]
MSLNDFYMEWLMTIREVRKVENNPYTLDLATSLTRRLTNLKCSMAFKMALYMDPRFSYINSTLFAAEEKEQIQRFIVRTWERIKQLNAENNNESTVLSNTSDKIDEKDDLITEMFGGTLGAPSSSNSTFQQQVKAVELEERQPTSYNVWDHWVKRKTSHFELSAVAAVVMSMPATQSMVERAFSALALVLSPHRSTLGDDTLKNILLIKLNRDVYEQVMPKLYNWNDALPELSSTSFVN